MVTSPLASHWQGERRVVRYADPWATAQVLRAHIFLPRVLPGNSSFEAVPFPELSWGPLIHARTGQPGGQCGLASGDVAARLLGLGTPGSPLSSRGAGGLASLSCLGREVGDVLLRFRVP